MYLKCSKVKLSKEIIRDIKDNIEIILEDTLNMWDIPCKTLEDIGDYLFDLKFEDDDFDSTF